MSRGVVGGGVGGKEKKRKLTKRQKNRDWREERGTETLSRRETTSRLEWEGAEGAGVRKGGRQSYLGLLRAPCWQRDPLPEDWSGKTLHRAGNRPHLAGLIASSSSEDGKWGSLGLGPSLCPTFLQQPEAWGCGTPAQCGGVGLGPDLPQ